MEGVKKKLPEHVMRGTVATNYTSVGTSNMANSYIASALNR